MKLFNIDYLAAEGQPVTIVAIKGFNSEDDAGKAKLKDGAVRLQARSADDLASLGAPVLEAIAAFKSGPKGQVAADQTSIWHSLNPPPKVKLTKPPADANNGETGDGVGQRTKERKMATKKKAAKKKVAAKKASTGPRGEKMKKLADKLASASGVTRAWVKENLGWNAISFQQVAKSLKRKLTQNKEKGKPTVYFAK
jgi:hypothetical protein